MSKERIVEKDKQEGKVASGDKVRVITAKRTEEGLLMPSPDEKAVMIKLSTGYNLGFEKKDVQKIELIQRQHIKNNSSKESSSELDKNTQLPCIVVLHTGGTIASRVDYSTGAVTAKFTAQDLVEMFPELAKIANVHTELVSNLMSEDIYFNDYQKIARTIKKYASEGVHGKKVKGIIVGHGTDTLSYTASALSFMFENINLPVLIVGSQRSPDRGSSDAGLNLMCAAKFILETDFSGVAVCMHHSSNDDECAILPATKVRKMHTSRRDAFKAINTDPLAYVSVNHIEFLQKDYLKKLSSHQQNSEIILLDKFEEKVGWLRAHPNMSPDLFRFFTEHYKAIVIEGTGLGHAPTNLGQNNLKNYDYLKSFIARGGIVAITSQCLYGRVHPYVYSNLRRLSDIGCIFCEDMLPETAFIKLAWLLGNYTREESKQLLAKNLRGEITPALKFRDHFLTS